MAANIPVISGGISYTAPTFDFGATTQAVNGGYSFDLPLAAVAAFTNNALDFSRQNTANAQGFLSGVITQAQGNVTQVAGQAFNLQNNALKSLNQMSSNYMDVNRYAIKKTAQNSMCFITTAVCKSRNLPDDCSELVTLRAFRDDFMLASDEGKALVKRYYEVAPIIVAAIDKLPNAASVYEYLNNTFITQALQRIGAGHFEIAQLIYTAMVDKAFELSGLENDTVTCTCKAGSRARNFHAKTCPVRGE